MVTEREQLVDLSQYLFGPDGARRFWQVPRYEWGLLTANELWDLGCRETVRRRLEDECWYYQIGVALRSVAMDRQDVSLV